MGAVGMGKRGVKIKYNDPIHEAWRLIAKDRYEKNKVKRTNGDALKCQ